MKNDPEVFKTIGPTTKSRLKLPVGPAAKNCFWGGTLIIEFMSSKSTSNPSPKAWPQPYPSYLKGIAFELTVNRVGLRRQWGLAR